MSYSGIYEFKILAYDLICKSRYNIVGVDNLEYGIKDNVPSGVKFVQEDVREKKNIQNI